MKNSKWVGIFGVVLVYIAVFQPWIYIPAVDLVVTGMQTKGTNFGKPGLLNLMVSSIAAILFYLPFVIAKRANLFFCAFNLAWSIRNYIIVSMCRMGDCPQKKFALYLLIAASLIMVVAALLPDLALKEEKKQENPAGGLP